MIKRIILGIVFGLVAAIIITKPSIFLSFIKPLKEIKLPASPKGTSSKPAPELDKSLLHNVAIDNFKLDGVNYSFANGEVTRTDKKGLSKKEEKKAVQFVFFYQWTREDPLFTSPYMDIEGLKKTTKLLDYIQNEYYKVAKKKDNFFPISLLKKLPDVFNAEKKLLNNPSDKEAQNLIFAYEKAGHAYSDNVNQFWQTVKNNEDKIPDAAYVSINSAANKSTFLSDAKKISQNAKYLLTEINQRKNCLNNGLFCIRPASDFTKPKLKALTDEKIEDLLPLPVLFPKLSREELADVKGPYIIKTACFGWEKGLTPKPQPIYIWPKEIKTYKGPYSPVANINFKLGSNIFFRKIAKDSWEKDFNTAIPYTPQAEDHFYICRDATYEAEVTTLHYFWQNFKDKKIFKEIHKTNKGQESEPFLSDGVRFEDDFFSKTPPSWTNAVELASYYAYAYTILPDNNTNKTYKNELLTRYLLINRRIADLPEFASNSVGLFLSTIIKEKNVPGFTTEDKLYYGQIYPSRNLWNTLYFPFSLSFWRHPENLSYLEKKNIETVFEGGPYIDYKIAKEMFSEKEMKKMYEEAAKFNIKSVDLN